MDRADNAQTSPSNIGAEGIASAGRDSAMFISAINHDIRTPLSVVLGAMDLIAGTDLDAQQRELVKLAQQSGQCLLYVISNLLDYGRLQVGELDLESVPFDLAKAVDGAMEAVAPGAHTKNIDLRLDLDSGTPAEMVGDQRRLKQVLFNLLSNAIKFTGQGHVVLSVSPQQDKKQDPGRVRFEVTDTGPGVPEQLRARLFSRPEVHDSAVAGMPGNVGLGLAISKHLVELMGGNIGLASTLGEGSTFWFDVPIRVRRPVIAPAMAERPTGNESLVAATRRMNAAGPRLILVADDNEANQELTRQILEMAGFDVDVVGDGRAAVTAVEERRYELVLMDIAMPGMNGVDATKAIRAGRGDHATVPIIALTASVSAGDRQRFQAAGMTDYMAKPIRLPRLLDIILRMLPNADVATPTGGHAGELAARPAEPGKAKAIIDTGALRELTQDMRPEAVAGLIDSFLADIETRASRVGEAAARGDVDALEQEAHSLSGSCATFGAIGLRNLAVAVEQACMAGRGQRAIDLSRMIGAAAEETRDAFAAHRAQYA